MRKTSVLDKLFLWNVEAFKCPVLLLFFSLKFMPFLFLLLQLNAAAKSQIFQHVMHMDIDLQF